MTPGPSTEQLFVQVAVRALDEVLVHKAQAGLKSQARMRAQEALALAVTQLWYRLPALDLRCTDEGLWWDEVLVLPREDCRSGLVPTLSDGGIQTLGFLPGAEMSDVHRFVDLLDYKIHRDEYGATELAGLLSGVDLPHVRHSVAEVQEEAPRPDPTEPPQAGDLLTTIRADAEASAPTGVVEPEEFDSTRYFLDRSEVDYLQAEVEKQYSLDHTRGMLDLLLDTLEIQTDRETRREVTEAIRALLPYLLGTGRFASLAYLGDQLRGILRQVELEPGHRDALKGILQSVSREGALTQIFLTLEDERVDPTPQSLEALVGQVDQRALETVLVWAGQLRRAEARAAVFGALETTFQKQPHRLVQLLASGQRTVVQEGLRMAAHLGVEELVEGVTATLGHEDATIRRQAVEVLGSMPGVAPVRGVARMLRDPDPEVRKASYQVFLNRPYRGVAKVLKAVLESADLESLDLSERKLLFTAFGATAGSEDAPDVAALLEGKRSFGQRPSSETRACAALALARIGTASAKTALTDARRSPDPVVRNAARLALQAPS